MTRTPAISVQIGDGWLARRHATAICALYDRVFSAPPFAWSDGDAASHRLMLNEISTDATFGVALALDGPEIVGFAYGHRLPVSHGWWSGFPAELPEDLVAEREGRTFALIDVAVHESYRGRGIGGTLLTRLLVSRPEERALLSVQPAAVQAQRIYEHLGWQRIGVKGPLSGVHPEYWAIYLIDLGRAARA